MTLGQHEDLKPSLGAAKTLTKRQGQTGPPTPTDHKYSEGEPVLVREYGAERAYRRYRNRHFLLTQDAKSHSFWCDWHAKL